MSTSSIGDSVTSIADSLEDEFLPASPFHPKNAELRRVVHNTSRMCFQPLFERIDSMGYRGEGIVEDMNNTAPISYSLSHLPPASRLRKPVAASLLVEAENSTRPPRSAHTPKNHPRSNFSLVALSSRVTCSSGPARPKSNSSYITVPPATAMKVAAASSSRQALKTTHDVPTIFNSEHTLSSDVGSVRHLFSGVSSAVSAKYMPLKQTGSTVSSPQKATGGSDHRKPAMPRHPLRGGAGTAVNAFGGAYDGDIIVHVPCKAERIDCSHSRQGRLPATNRRREMPLLTVEADISGGSSPHSTSPSKIAASASLPTSRLRFLPAERGNSSGGSGSSSPQLISPQKHTAVRSSATPAQTGPGHAAKLAALSTFPTQRVASMSLPNLQRAQSNVSGSSAPLRQSISRRGRSLRLLPQCTAEVNITEASEAAAVPSPPKASKGSSAPSHSNSSSPQGPTSTTSAALDEASATASSDYGSPPTVRVLRSPAKMSALSKDTPTRS
ncbi:hypothetical protein GH5_01224 [Leishmania sp. Ghana 2012 LV757]|uniref:hypothetical protein n=1 Tax=Leishmania sp. Ghana 2012 LV757 TaxID=2803181 RepID=UPI001B5B974B|nr:hypothetical protein GH5_01224 [Leishmania sp. Ghana 2012 LV757]